MGEEKALAKEYLSSNWYMTIWATIISYGVPILLIFITTLSIRLVGLTAANFKHLSVDYRLLIILLPYLIETFIFSLFQAGYIQFGLNLISKKELSLHIIFSKGVASLKLFIINLVTTFTIIVVDFVCFNLLYSILGKFGLSFIGILVGIVTTIYIHLTFALAPYFVLDDDNISVINAITQSIDFMHDKKYDLFMIYLSYILEFLISCFCCVGFIYTLPMINVSKAIFYSNILEEMKFSR